MSSTLLTIDGNPPLSEFKDYLVIKIVCYDGYELGDDHIVIYINSIPTGTIISWLMSIVR